MPGPPAPQSPGPWLPRLALEARLAAAEARLEGDPGDLEARFDRAQLLRELGRASQARQAYLDLLARAPGHLGALINLGELLHATQYRRAARTCFREAVARHPDHPLGHLNLAHALFQEGDYLEAKGHYEAGLKLDPDQPEAHQGLAFTLLQLDDRDGAAAHRQLGFAGHAAKVLPYRGDGPPVPILMLASALGGNMPILPLLDEDRFQVTVIYPEFFGPEAPLPAHDLLINALGDADLCAPGLAAAERLAAASPAPVLNPPRAVAATGRIANARRLGALEDVVTPAMADFPRAELERPGALDTLAERGFRPPFLLRTPGFHNGQHFVKVDGPEAFVPALGSLPGQELTALEFLDARAADGKVRKYRAMIVDGNLYPLHAAVSAGWKIHYVSADMADNPGHRAEDEAFLERMPEVLGPRAMAALGRIRDALGLDYAGVDFSLDGQGRVLVYEANADMVVYAPEPDPRWAFRSAPVARVMDAVRAMVARRLVTTAPAPGR